MLRRAMMAGVSGGAGDPYWANVVSLLHLDVAGTSVTDEKGKTWSFSGTATQSSAQSKFGSASAEFGSAASSYLASDAYSDFAFGSADFTIEFFMRPSASGTQRNFLDVRDSPPATTADRIILYHPGSNRINLYVNSANRISGSTELTSGTWYHVALTRASNVFTLFVNGASQGSYTASVNLTQKIIRLGSDTVTASINGYIDEVRITNGVARYTAGFTPPSSPFPNS